MFFRSLILSLVFVSSLGISRSFADDTNASPGSIAATTQSSDDGIKFERSEGKNGGSDIRIKMNKDSNAEVLIPITFFLMIITLVWLKQRSKQRQAEVRLEAIKIMADKGMAITPDMLPGTPSEEGAPLSKATSLRKAFSHLGLGVAFIVFFLVKDPHNGVWAIGLIFILSSVGHFIAAKKTKDSPTS